MANIIKKIFGSVKEAVGMRTPAESKNVVLNKNIDLMVKAAVDHNRDWAPILNDGMNYLWNRQLLHKERHQGWDRIQVNHLFPAAQQSLSYLALQRPRFLAKPAEPGDIEGAAKWEQALQWQFEEGLDVPLLRLQSKLDGQAYGQWVAWLYWEPEARWDDEAQAWKGELRRTLLRPEFFGCDPNATLSPSGKLNAEFTFMLRRVPVTWATQRWPKHAVAIENAAAKGVEGTPSIAEAVGRADEIETDSDYIEYDATAVSGGKGTTPPDAVEGRLAQLLAKRGKVAQQQRGGSQKEGSVVLLTIFFKDRTKETVERRTPIPFDELVASGRFRLENRDGVDVYVDTTTDETVTEDNVPEDVERIEVPKYPYGRRILRVGENVILEDDPWDMAEWPFVVGRNIPLPHTWRGLNATEMARGLQDFKNIIATVFCAYIKQHALPITAVEQGAVQGAPDNTNVAEHLASHPGSIWKLSPNKMQAILRMMPPPMAQTAFQIWEAFSQELRDTTGGQEISMGRKTPGETTATEAIKLESNAKVRTALENLFMDMFTLDLMKRVHMFCRKHWQVGDMVRVVGEEQPITVDEMMLDAKFDLKMEIGTVMPFDQERERIKADSVLSQVGPAYLLEWLKAYEVKNAEAFAEAGAQWQAYQMEAQQTTQSKQLAQSKSGSGSAASQGGS